MATVAGVCNWDMSGTEPNWYRT